MEDIQQVNDPMGRAWAFEALLPWLSEPRLEEALDAIRSVDSPEERSRLLAIVASRLPEERRFAALSEALDAAELIRQSPFDVARSSTIGERREVLAELAPELPGRLLPDALAAARRLDDDEAKAIALGATVKNPPTEADAGVLEEALAAARRAGPFSIGTAIASLAPRLPPGLTAEAFAVATTDTTDSLGEALVALAPELPADLVDDAMDVAQRIPSERPRAAAIAALSCRLPTEARQAAQLRALDVAASGAYYDDDGLPAISNYIDLDLIPKAIDVARSLPPGSRSKALLALSERVSEPVKRRVLAEVLMAARELSRYEAARVVARVAGKVDEDAREPLVDEVIETLAIQGTELPADVSTNEDDRVQLMIDIAPFLNDRRLERAIGLARQLGAAAARSRALAALAPQATRLVCSSLLVDALTAASEIVPAGWRLWVIADAASMASPALLVPEITTWCAIRRPGRNR
jgi:hypothetical protein